MIAARLDLDGFDWAEASFTGYGLRVAIRANSDAALSELTTSIPPGLKPLVGPPVDLQYTVVKDDAAPAEGAPRYHVAYVDESQIARSPDFRTVVTAVENHLSLHIAEFATSRVFIHAGVVGWNGKAIIIPGRSRAGKSTLVTALLRAGATYYSDEYAIVDRAGLVHAHPAPIQLRSQSGRPQRVRPAELGAPVGKKPLPVGLVLITHYRQNARWRPRQASAGEGLLALLSNTVSAQRNPRRALMTLTAMLSGARTLKGPRGDADAVIARMIRVGQLPA